MKRFARGAATMLLGVALVRTAVGASAMTDAMDMNDDSSTGMLWLDQLEWRTLAPSKSTAWQGEGWFGTDYNKLWARSEGDAFSAVTADARAELFWDHALARWWNLELGGREDLGVGPARGWAALGIRGLAPQGVDVEATLYAGAAARTAARLKIEYELLFTQRLILQPEIEINLYGKADPMRDIAAGVSDFEAGLRLRYEVRREFAPYAGLVWARRFGAAGAFLRTAAFPSNELCLALGLRVWL
jgi:copper resistance protein B